ncbi:MAG: dihydrodipicolinate reductase [Deltaproteobacteria bacterium SG8_13]|nr:MAG: dihydrodipicolinate reductase [Deltaproteobacteria bacterium SG8_13]
MEPIRVMINGLPGNMSQVVLRHALRDSRFTLLPYSLTGPEITDPEFRQEGQTIQLLHPDDRDEAIGEIRSSAGDFISIDFTHPSAVNDNAVFYCSNALPFVMGTTGGDRKKLEASVTASSIAAVIAPNMAKQIVGFQAMMEYAANTFPKLFEGYTLAVKESHQQGKADTSGTAKAMVKYFNALGTPFKEEDIVKERDPENQQNRWGIPAGYLRGHGWHTYSLLSADQTVRFEFTHNVNGREIYAGGTLDAVVFLHKKLAQGASGKTFTMIDVLTGA